MLEKLCTIYTYKELLNRFKKEAYSTMREHDDVKLGRDCQSQTKEHIMNSSV